ncbi:MAG TPA: hypothetical protein VND64_08780 [Pirellulales bacterium]|nr:hypothetical protein [Pirellulales bacterium]
MNSLAEHGTAGFHSTVLKERAVHSNSFLALFPALGIIFIFAIVYGVQSLARLAAVNDVIVGDKPANVQVASRE